MNVTTRGTIIYHATCDLCEKAGPESVVLADAVRDAFASGWKVVDYYDGLCHKPYTMCPKCTTEPDYAQWLEVLMGKEWVEQMFPQGVDAAPMNQTEATEEKP